MKVGGDRASDLRRGKIIRSIVDDPQWLPEGHKPREPSDPSLVGKNAGPTGSVFMIDANQVWDVKEAIDWTASLAELKPWSASSLLYPFFRGGSSYFLMIGLLRSQQHPMIYSDTQQFARPLSHTESVWRLANTHTIEWCSNNFSRPRLSMCARLTHAVLPVSAKC